MRREGPPSLRTRLGSALPYAVLLCGAAYLYANAAEFAHHARPGELGPDVWPRAILVLLMLVCAGAIARRIFFAREERAAAEPGAMTGDVAAGAGDEPPAAQDERATHPYLLLAGIALSAAYVAGLEWLGFFVATTLYLALFMAFGRYRRPGVIVSVSVLGSLAFIFVFMKIVYVSLPLGVGPFQTISVGILAALGVR